MSQPGVRPASASADFRLGQGYGQGKTSAVSLHDLFVAAGACEALGVGEAFAVLSQANMPPRFESAGGRTTWGFDGLFEVFAGSS